MTFIRLLFATRIVNGGILGYGIFAHFYFGIWDIDPNFLGYWIFRNFGIWDIGIYFGIRVKLILGYGIFWTVYFGIIMGYCLPPKQASIFDNLHRGL